MYIVRLDIVDKDTLSIIHSIDSATFKSKQDAKEYACRQFCFFNYDRIYVIKETNDVKKKVFYMEKVL